jgi:hypothetical protein
MIKLQLKCKNEVKDSKRDVLESDLLLQLVQRALNKDLFPYKDSDMVNQNGKNHNNKPEVIRFLVPAIKAKEDFHSQIPTVQSFISYIRSTKRN